MNNGSRQLLVIVDNVENYSEAISYAVKESNRFVNKKVAPWTFRRVTMQEMLLIFWDEDVSIADHKTLLRTETPYATSVITRFYHHPPIFKDGQYYIATDINPDIKMTSFTLSGKGSQLFPNLEDNGHTACLQKKNLGLVNLYAPSRIEAIQTYDDFEAVLKQKPWIEEPGPNYETLLKKYHQDEMLARHEYAQDEWRQTIREAFSLEVDPVEHFFYGTGGRDAYVINAGRETFHTDAVLDSDGEWWERAIMWKDRSLVERLPEREWLENFYGLLSGTDEDSWLVLMDILPITLDEAIYGDRLEEIEK